MTLIVSNRVCELNQAVTKSPSGDDMALGVSKRLKSLKAKNQSKKALIAKNKD